MKKPMKKTVKKADGGVIMSPVSNPKMSPGNTGPGGKMKPFERGGGERPSGMGKGARPMPMPSRPGGLENMPRVISKPSTPRTTGPGERARPIGGGRTPIPMAKKKGGMAKGKKK